jgi:DNA-binding transcriptional LysR family regulator
VRVSVPFIVAFVPGVTPGKWERTWRERMPRSPLEVRALPPDAALAALHDASAHMALVRDVPADDELHVIPLYRERAVVVAPKDHPVAAFDELTLADLAGETLLDGQGADTVELVAAGVGLALMPMSVARAHSRRDVVARPVVDAPDTGIGLAWLRTSDDPRLDTFIGIVRGRTANTSR